MNIFSSHYLHDFVDPKTLVKLMIKNAPKRQLFLPTANASISTILTLSSVKLLQSARNVLGRLLHRVQLAVPSHGIDIFTMRLNQVLQPLNFAIAHMSRLLGRRVRRRIQQRLYHLRLLLAIVQTVPFLSLFLVVGVQRVIERVISAADDADDVAILVSLDFGFRKQGLLCRRDGEWIGFGGGGGLAELCFRAAGGCF